MISPILTEKTLKEAKLGRYTFKVGVQVAKKDVSKMLEATFGVHVKDLWLLKFKGGIKRDMGGKLKKIKAFKKAVVTLADKEKIDLFEEK